MAKIVTVFTSHCREWDPREMSDIRWHKISEALARQGHEVDIATNEPRWEQDRNPVVMAERLRRVPLRRVRWSSYDVVKTLFNLGFETLVKNGGARHPFIISKLGSVVGPADAPGIYFYGDFRRALYETQKQIHRTSRFVTLLSPPAIDLWTQVHGHRPGILLVPGAADAEIPAPGPNPYVAANIPGKICIFSGNVYEGDSQPEANRTLVRKLNDLGRALEGSGVRLCFQGVGDLSALDERHVTNLGSCSYPETWRYLQHANVGVVVSAGPFMHNNESTKIYHYLRAGLPVVSEQGFPNEWVLKASGIGLVVPGEDMQRMAEGVVQAANMSWNCGAARQYILDHHTWDHRARVYKDVIPQCAEAPRLHPLALLRHAMKRQSAT